MDENSWSLLLSSLGSWADRQALCRQAATNPPTAEAADGPGLGLLEHKQRSTALHSSSSRHTCRKLGKPMRANCKREKRN